MRIFRPGILVWTAALLVTWTSSAAQQATTAPAEGVTTPVQATETVQTSAPADAEQGAVSPARSQREDATLPKPGATNGMGGYAQTLGALAAVIGLIFVARLLLRRASGAKGSSRLAGPMEVIARTTVGPKQQLLLVRLGERLVMVGCGPAGFASLGEVTHPQEMEQLIEAAGQARPAFGTSLKRKRESIAAAVGESKREPAAPPSPLRELAEKMRWRLTEEKSL